MNFKHHLKSQDYQATLTEVDDSDTLPSSWWDEDG